MTQQSPIGKDALWFTGEDQLLEWTVYESDRQTLVDVTGWTTEFRMALLANTPSLLTKSGAVVDATGGKLRVTIVQNDTLTLTPANYTYTFSRIDAGSNQVLAFGDALLNGRVE